jgi:hypothetical protein
LSSIHPPSNGLEDYAINPMATQVMHNTTNNQVSAKNAFTSLSPECWTASINTLNQLAIGLDLNNRGNYQKRITSLGSYFRSSMAVVQQGILTCE